MNTNYINKFQRESEAAFPDENSEPQDNWISVSERFPENDDNVIAYSTYPSFINCRIEVVFYDNDIKSWAGTNSYFLSGITHWQPLLNPPKQ